MEGDAAREVSGASEEGGGDGPVEAGREGSERFELGSFADLRG